MGDILKTHGYSLSPWKISPLTRVILDWLKKKEVEILVGVFCSIVVAKK
jgi:hypothetical protein